MAPLTGELSSVSETEGFHPFDLASLGRLPLAGEVFYPPYIHAPQSRFLTELRFEGKE